ncbi:OVCH2 [Lepeophtheirus salmonis]|uniref:OVCH2 n=1 Tax=Lepeophtheirus salmonis TaxID=72036 RepID=A0A7R8CMJ3_LEPSM|nr:OVCH2 [Lepeophtheirus salmonis]CAF2867175.1 OVCH2 [Lepeophtheirus salmonis]
MRILGFLAIIASALANPKHPDTCGSENKPLVDSKTVGRQEAARHQFLWLACVYNFGACTGFVLDENWIITAKHCIISLESAKVRVGAHNIADDFALIELESPLELNEYVGPVCLPTREDANETFVGKSTTITGWVIECNWRGVICTDSNPGKAICFGDSDGLLNYEMEDGKYMQIGVNRFVTNPKCVGGINGYARITSHLDFIQEITGMVIE